MRCCYCVLLSSVRFHWINQRRAREIRFTEWNINKIIFTCIHETVICFILLHSLNPFSLSFDNEIIIFFTHSLSQVRQWPRLHCVSQNTPFPSFLPSFLLGSFLPSLLLVCNSKSLRPHECSFSFLLSFLTATLSALSFLRHLTCHHRRNARPTIYWLIDLLQLSWQKPQWLVSSAM